MKRVKEYSGKLLKETSDLLLVEHDEDTAAFYAKELMDNLERRGDFVHFTGEHCFVRNVTLT